MYVWSEENRFRMRPMGVVSKNLVGALSTQWSIPSCISTAARRQPIPTSPERKVTDAQAKRTNKK
jgi:hypothetical protein